MVPELSVVILCYRAGRTIGKFVKHTAACLDEAVDNWQMVLVGNYFQETNDITPQVVRDLAENDDSRKYLTLNGEPSVPDVTAELLSKL